MKTRRIGSLEVTPVGLGCNNFGWFLPDEAASGAVIDAAFDAGINFFDTADVYGNGQSEILLGKALRGRRDRAVIVTKFGFTMGSFEGGGRPEYAVGGGKEAGKAGEAFTAGENEIKTALAGIR